MGRALFVEPCAFPDTLYIVANDAYTLGSMLSSDPSMTEVKQGWIDSGMWTPENGQTVYLWQTSQLADTCRLISPEWGDAPLMGTSIIANVWVTVTLSTDESMQYPVWNLLARSVDNGDSTVDLTAEEEVLVYVWSNPPSTP